MKRLNKYLLKNQKLEHKISIILLVLLLLISPVIFYFFIKNTSTQKPFSQPQTKQLPTTTPTEPILEVTTTPELTPTLTESNKQITGTGSTSEGKHTVNYSLTFFKNGGYVSGTISGDCKGCSFFMVFMRELYHLPNTRVFYKLLFM